MKKGFKYLEEIKLKILFWVLVLLVIGYLPAIALYNSQKPPVNNYLSDYVNNNFLELQKIKDSSIYKENSSYFVDRVCTKINGNVSCHNYSEWVFIFGLDDIYINFNSKGVAEVLHTYNGDIKPELLKGGISLMVNELNRKYKNIYDLENTKQHN